MKERKQITPLFIIYYLFILFLTLMLFYFSFQSPTLDLPNGDESFEGETLIIEELGAYDGGIYKCTAQNTAGDDTQAVDIQVLCK